MAQSGKNTNGQQRDHTFRHDRETVRTIEIVMASLRSWFLSVAGISLVVNLLAFTGPLFMLQVYDRVLVSGSVPTLMALGFLALVLYLFFGLLEGLRSRILLRIGQQVDADLSAQAYTLSTQIPVRYGSKGHSVRPVQDLDSVTGFMSGNGPSAVFDVPWLPIYLSVIFLFHSSLGYVALFGAVTICLLVALNEFTSRGASQDAAQTRARRAGLVEESPAKCRDRQSNGHGRRSLGKVESGERAVFVRSACGGRLERLLCNFDQNRPVLFCSLPFLRLEPGWQSDKKSRLVS